MNESFHPLSYPLALFILFCFCFLTAFSLRIICCFFPGHLPILFHSLFLYYLSFILLFPFLSLPPVNPVLRRSIFIVRCAAPPHVQNRLRTSAILPKTAINQPNPPINTTIITTHRHLHHRRPRPAGRTGACNFAGLLPPQTWGEKTLHNLVVLFLFERVFISKIYSWILNIVLNVTEFLPEFQHWNSTVAWKYIQILTYI